MYVGPSGADIQTCGWKELPCLTINYAFTVKPASIKRIELLENTHTVIETNTTTITSADLTVIRESTLTSNPSKQLGALTVDGSTAVFVVDTTSTSSLTLKQIDFILTTACQVVSVGGGVLILDSISIASVTPGSAVTMSSSAVSISSGGSASIASCAFTDLTYSDGNGAAISATLSSTSTLNITGSTFTDCRSGNMGGGIFVNHTTLLSNELKAVLKVINTVFEYTSMNYRSGNSEMDAGMNAYIISNDLAHLIQSVNWEGTNVTSPSENSFWVSGSYSDGIEVNESLNQFLSRSEGGEGEGGVEEEKANHYSKRKSSASTAGIVLSVVFLIILVSLVTFLLWYYKGRGGKWNRERISEWNGVHPVEMDAPLMTEIGKKGEEENGSEYRVDDEEDTLSSLHTHPSQGGTFHDTFDDQTLTTFTTYTSIRSESSSSSSLPPQSSLLHQQSDQISTLTNPEMTTLYTLLVTLTQRIPDKLLPIDTIVAHSSFGTAFE